MSLAPIAKGKASEMASDWYEGYGKYANATRGSVGLDGLLPVHRRLLLAARDEATNKLVGSQKVVGKATSDYHPHGTESCYNTLVKLVNVGLLKGKGNFGVIGLDPQPPAAMRYTKTMANSEISKSVFRLVPYVPTYENEFGNSEPLYLPTPIPLVLTFGHIGMGVGLLADYPKFSPRSIYEALKHDDPNKLQAPSHSFIRSADLDKLWHRGEGWITYGIKCYREHVQLDEKDVTIIEGNPNVVIPNLEAEFAHELDNDLMYYRDESSGVLRVVVSRFKNIRRISDDEVFERCQKAAVAGKFCRLYVTEGDVVKRISLKDWLNLTWETYKTTYQLWKDESIDRLQFRKLVYECIPLVYPLVVEGLNSEEISKKLDIDVVVVKEVESKAIRLLRKADHSSTITSIVNEINEINKTTPEQFAEEFIDSLEQSQEL